jgi:ribosomal protein S3
MGEMARTIDGSRRRTIAAQTLLRADIWFCATQEANTIYGVLGIKFGYSKWNFI